MNQSGKRALVTGGSGGIGGALCRRLALAGHHVYVHSHTGGAIAQKLVAEIRAQGGAATAIAFDITDTTATRLALEAALETGPIQILVNNAGVFDYKPLPDITETHFHNLFDVNVLGVLMATRCAVANFCPAGGSVINISSLAARADAP